MPRRSSTPGIRKRGDSYEAQLRVKGFPSETRTFDRLADAETWIIKSKAAMRSQKWQDGRKARETPFVDLLQKYLDEECPKMASGDNQQYKVLAMMEHKLFSKPVSAITPEDIDSYKKERVCARMAASTINIELSLLSSVFKMARRHGFPNLGNPASADLIPRMKRPPEATRDRTGTEEEVNEILRNSDSSFLRPFVILLLETAARRSDLIRLRWESVDLDSDTPSVHFVYTKNDQPRRIPLSPKAAKVLEALPGLRKGPIFKKVKWKPEGPQDDGANAPALRADSVTQAWIRARDRAGESNPDLRDLRLHDNRHTAITYLVQDTDLKPLEVAAISGHKDIRVLKRYFNPDAAKLSRKLGWQRSEEKTEQATESLRIVVRKDGNEYVAIIGDVEARAPSAKEAKALALELTAD